MFKEFKYQFIAPLKYKFELHLYILAIFGALTGVLLITLPILAAYVDMSENAITLIMGLGYVFSMITSLILVMLDFNEYKSGSAQYRITLGSSYAKQMSMSTIKNMLCVFITSIPALIFSLMIAPFSVAMNIQIFFMIILIVPLIYFLYMAAAGITGRETISKNIITLIIAGFGYVFVNGLSLANPEVFFIHMTLISNIWFYVPLAFSLLFFLGIWFILPRLSWMRQSIETINRS